MKTMQYAGIGSRSTPIPTLTDIVDLALGLSSLGYTLRSGGAQGADQAFDKGADGEAIIILPWDGFERFKHRGKIQTIDMEDEAAVDSVFQFHPNAQNLSLPITRLMARNYRQVVIADDPLTLVDFVVCWTPLGSGTNPTREGGTGQALRIARHYGVKIFNLNTCTPMEPIRWLGSLK